MQSYQRGVILGLTLAEVFIVLLFIFLIVFTSKDNVSQFQNAEESENQIGVTDSEEFSHKSFPIPVTAAPLSPNGSPLPEPPPLGVDLYNPEPPTILDQEEQYSVSQEPLQSSDGKFILNQNEFQTDRKEETQNGLISNEAAQNGHNWPPVITITEAQGYSFPVGSAFISETFGEMLKTIVAKTLKDNIEKYNANIIEVYGHTDEQPKQGVSNLDNFLIQAINGNYPIEKLSTSDNVGLGMARAVAVSQILMQCPELQNVKILSYSAGQSINNTGSISSKNLGDEPSRRRIEIRLRGI